jgi:hypothetical protein
MVLSKEEIQDLRRMMTSEFGRTNIEFRKKHSSTLGIDTIEIRIHKQGSKKIWETYGILVNSDELNNATPKLSRVALENEEIKDNVREKLDSLFEA